MLLPELRTEVVRYAKKMHDSGLVRATQGNLSVRDPESGLICLTPSGVDYAELTGEDIVVVDRDGRVVEGKWKPTSELPLHRLVLARRSDVHCVMHTHSPYATAFGVIYQPIPMILQDSALCLGGTVPVAPYQMSGTEAFAEAVLEALGQGTAVIWGNHGGMVVGVDLAQTYSAAHALEDSAHIYTIAKHLGTPVHLPDEDVRQLHQVWRGHYGRTVLA